MSTSNHNNDQQLLAKLLTSDFAKTFIAILLTVGGMSISLVDAKNDLQKTMIEINHKIELQSKEMKYELQIVKEKQVNDFKYITENYVKKSELQDIKGKK